MVVLNRKTPATDISAANKPATVVLQFAGISTTLHSTFVSKLAAFYYDFYNQKS